ncbi:exported hypothetical protein [Nostocoides jenkinsii Ben 74]|uniref:Uncharacterized protein n=1 Tax=Nostocoides jenkinsii Ben 74 TaxID=1193518 RepID=A0A077MAQ3_9MICO|nr:exported hypothetical protein [Tetrasphaera jenkinsii Ben 74]
MVQTVTLASAALTPSSAAEAPAWRCGGMPLLRWSCMPSRGARWPPASCCRGRCSGSRTGRAAATVPLRSNASTESEKIVLPIPTESDPDGENSLSLPGSLTGPHSIMVVVGQAGSGRALSALAVMGRWGNEPLPD